MTEGPEQAAGAAISVRGLRKTYGGLVAVESLDLEVAKGELLCLVGPNGAGKTSTVEVIEGYRRADRGEVLVLGLDPLRQARRLRPQIGLMLQEGGIYPTLKVAETMRLFASFFAHPVNPAEMLARVGLEERSGSRFRQLSGGEKQRLSLGLALLGRPQVLFLDEPTSGMDPRARLLTWELVQEAKRAGTTILLTTHGLEEAERLADRVAVLARGRLVACDTPARLRDLGASSRLELELDREPREELLRRIRALPQVSRVTELGGGRYRLDSSSPADTAADLTQLLRHEDAQLVQLRRGAFSLEETFLELTGPEA